MDKRAQKWVWSALIALGAAQLYFVRELLAALIVFAVAFAALALAGLLLYLVHLGGTRAMAAAEGWLKALARSAKERALSLRPEQNQ
jgi:hypothetical protein